MKKSIRLSLFLLFAGMMLSFMLFGMLLNVFGLEKYYVHKNKALFATVASEVLEILSSNQNAQEAIEKIDRAEGISITLTDKKYTILRASFLKKELNSRVPKEIENVIENSKFNLKKTAIYTIVEKKETQPKLVYVFMTQDEQFLILTKSMKGIRESAGIANQFYIMAGLLAFLVGSVFMFRFSGKVTKPIVQMSGIAEDISNLNFTRKVAVKNTDELGILAKSINILSDRLKASIDGLKNDIEFQKSLSRNMSHELKTPIGVIKGYTEGLLFGVADNPEMRDKYLQVIVQECDRMDTLIKEVLQLSRLSAKDNVLQNVEPFEIKSLFASIEERFELELREQNIRFFKEIKGSVQVYANYELILRAVSNLVSNAIRYNDQNKYVSLVAAGTNDAITISVFNTCDGIPENETQKIFDEFYKVDKAHTREKGGHGLGLSIVKSIALLHKGSISVCNKEGGVEFILSLPRQVPLL